MGMAVETAAKTVEELWALPDDGLRRELVGGELRVMTPAGAEHGRVTATVGILLGAHVRETASGVTFGAETGFVLARDPDTVRAPDAAFVTKDHADAIGRTVKYFAHLRKRRSTGFEQAASPSSFSILHGAPRPSIAASVKRGLTAAATHSIWGMRCQAGP
jgi:hypothetical protein